MQRTILGILAAALLLGSAAIWAIAPSDSTLHSAEGAMVRLGLIFGAMWLAIPNFTIIFVRVPPWLIAATIAALFVVARWPRTIFVLGPLMILLWILGPNWLGRRRK
jgi:hypothetical protein